MIKRKYLIIITVVVSRIGFVMAQPMDQSFDQALRQLEQRGAQGEAFFVQTVRPLGNSAVPQLIDALNNKNPEVVSVILKTLVAIKAPCDQISKKVSAKLDDPSWLVRYDALAALAFRECSGQKDNVISRLVIEKDPLVLGGVLDTIGLLGEIPNTPIIQTYQDDLNQPWNIRLAAATALLRLSNQCDRNLLKQALLQNDAQIKRKALLAFALTDDDTIIAEIEPLAQQGSKFEEPAKIAMAGIRLNRMEKNDVSRQEKLFSYVEGDDPYLIRWATRKLINDYSSQKNVGRLKSIAATSISPDPIMSHPGRSTLVSVLIKEGLLSDLEVKQLMEGDRSQTEEK